MNEHNLDDSTLSTERHMRVPLSEERLLSYLEAVRTLTAAFESVDDHVVITDPNGNIIFANEAAERNTGYSREQMRGNNPGDLWGGHMPKEFYERMWHRVKVEKLPFTGEVRNVRKDGTEYWQEVHISPVLWGNGDIKFYIGIEPNITKRKEKEKFREEFTSILAHQLKTPLTSYKWMLEWLSGEGNLTADQKEKIALLYQENESLINLVSDLLTYARIGSISELKKGKIDLAEEIEIIIKNAKAKHPYVVFSFIKEGAFMCTSYKSLVLQVFANIIFNAAEYSSAENGKVDIGLTAQEDGQFLFSCKDNGVGIPLEDQAHIFSKFFRASNAHTAKYKGTGLGLFIVKLIADSIGWNVSFRSPAENNEGTIFYVKISYSKK